MPHNLIYHIYPRPSDALILNLECLEHALPIFDGQLLFTIAQDSTTLSSRWIVDWLLCRLSQSQREKTMFNEISNSGGETASFFDFALPCVESRSGEDRTCVAHAKGTSVVDGKARNVECVLAWTHWLYEHTMWNLRARRALEHKTCSGSLRYRIRPPGERCPWHFSGTFFWFRHDKVFSRDWRPKRRTRYSVEAWLGNFVPFEESECLWGDGTGALYTPERIRTVVPFHEARTKIHFIRAMRPRWAAKVEALKGDAYAQGDHSSGRCGDPAGSSHDGGQQAAAADLQQAHDLLPADDAHGVRNPGHPGDQPEPQPATLPHAVR